MHILYVRLPHFRGAKPKRAAIIFYKADVVIKVQTALAEDS